MHPLEVVVAELADLKEERLVPVDQLVLRDKQNNNGGYTEIFYSASSASHSTSQEHSIPRTIHASNDCSSSFTVPSGVMISRPCRTSYQYSPSSAIPCFPRDSLRAYRRPFCDVTAVCRIWSTTSSTSSLLIHFPLDHTLHQLAPAVSDGVSKEGEFATYNKS